MSYREKHGGPAFPITPENEVRMNGNGGRGMTLRDYFAGQVMGGHMEAANEPLEIIGEETEDQAYLRFWSERAAFAYVVADAMLKAREVDQ